MDNMFRKLLAKIGFGSPKPLSQGSRQSRGVLSSGMRQASRAPQSPKSLAALDGRVITKSVDHRLSATDQKRAPEQIQSSMRRSVPHVMAGVVDRRSIEASASVLQRAPGSIAQRISDDMSLERDSASSHTAANSSSLPPAERPNLSRAVASSPLANSASSYQPTTQPSTVLPQGRSGDVGGLVLGSNGSAHEPHAEAKLPPQPARLAPNKPREERSTANDDVSFDESLQQFQQAYEKLTQDYGEFIRRKRRPATEAEYRKVAQRAINRADPPILTHYSRRARAKVRAAIVFVAIGKIRESLAKFLEGRDALALDARAVALADGHRWVARIRALEEPIGQDDEVGNKMSRRPARRKLRALPVGWELRVFQAARKHPRWFYGVCVSLASGARPIELERGVRVRREGVNLELLIQTAKSSEEHEGIGERSLVLAPEEPWVKALADELGGRTEMVVTWPTAKKSFDAVAAIGRSAIPDAKEAISGYLLRHRFANLLKKAKWSPFKIAQALGHSSTKQLSTYGIWNGAARGGLPVRVGSERAPRIVDKPRDFIARRPNGPKKPVAG
jgi:integrase